MASTHVSPTLGLAMNGFGATWPFWFLSRNINRLASLNLCLRTRLVVGASPHCFVLYHNFFCKIIVQLQPVPISFQASKPGSTYLNI